MKLWDKYIDWCKKNLKDFRAGEESDVKASTRFKLVSYTLGPRKIYDAYEPIARNILTQQSPEAENYIAKFKEHVHGIEYPIEELLAFTLKPLVFLVSGMTYECQNAGEGEIYQEYEAAISSAKQINEMSNGLFCEMSEFVIKAAGDYIMLRSRTYETVISNIIAELKEKGQILQSDFTKAATKEIGDHFAQTLRVIIRFAEEDGIISRTKKGNSYLLELSSAKTPVKRTSYSSFNFARYKFLVTLIETKSD